MIRPLPDPHATRVQNLVATMIVNDNFAASLDLDVIARFQGFDPVELRAEFARQEAARLTSVPPNVENGVEGK